MLPNLTLFQFEIATKSIVIIINHARRVSFDSFFQIYLLINVFLNLHFLVDLPADLNSEFFYFLIAKHVCLKNLIQVSSILLLCKNQTLQEALHIKIITFELLPQLLTC